MPINSSHVPDGHRVQRPGLWLPEDHRAHQKWLQDTVNHVDENPKDFHPAVRELEELIENNSRIHMLAQGMFDEIPDKHPYNKDPSGKMSIRGCKHMLAILNHLITTSPGWSKQSENVGLVGLPIYALFDWPMGTTFGFSFFLDPQVNGLLKKILNVWGEYLKSEDSREPSLSDKFGWFTDSGRKDLATVANLGEESDKALPFEQMFQCDPSKPYHGYKSWDDFFTREFHWDKRPVAEPENQNVIANACESTAYRVARDVKARDKFWLKGMPYSVKDILQNDPNYEQFVGGTIYQAFLSALSYHRWHTPVDGTVKKITHVEGTYYSEPLFEDFGRHPEHANEEGETESQGYLTAAAARALVFIEADNPKIGLMCVVLIGMSEVSSNDVTVKEGQKIKKGEQLGMFHFGGSTHCLMFRKGVKVSGFPEPGKVKHNIPVRSKVAIVED
ncbi:hypothetical protein LTS08_005450 [Lithohypha guttulata]|uniref:uncharacterized protein n=1 Tax=Lithohypha guttulata TaxID=1690604 RepID=UPI002DE0A92D|nr:hypothetical protein LTR51_003371 [Lithohypha guttulata]KAK5099735.1 hypothetical protein LTS08_005450 [Lithohypha guttulata]